MTQILDEVKDFQTEVIEESQRRPVAVDFWAAWCGPCRILGPILEKLAAEFQGDFLLAKVNTEVQPELAQRFQIRSIPHVKIFKQGRIVDELTGAVSESQAREFLRRHCPSAADRKCEEGTKLLGRGKIAEARKLFESALELQPVHAAARLGLGKALAKEGKTEEAVAAWELIPNSSPLWEQAQILKQSLQFQIVCAEAGGAETCRTRAASNPGELEARYAHACCLAAARNERAALEEFLFVVARDKNFRAGAARKAMLTLFALVGERSDLAEEYRKRLALVLF